MVVIQCRRPKGYLFEVTAGPDASPSSQISHLMSVSSHPEGKKPMLRANMELIAGLVSLFGEESAVTDSRESPTDADEKAGERPHSACGIRLPDTCGGHRGCDRGG